MQRHDANRLLACPDCGQSFGLLKGSRLTCAGGHIFPVTNQGVPQLIPKEKIHSPTWEEWEKKQREGHKDYLEPDDHYHEVSNGVARLFGTFVGFHGTILDLGCGIQPTLAYTPKDIYQDVTYVGLDPLPNVAPMPFFFVQGLAERIPFKTQSFDQVILATSLDHMIDSRPVFQELRRVIKPTGEVVIWSGIIEYIPASDIHVGTWLKEVAYLASRLQFRRAARRFFLPYPVAGLDYQPADRYHFHRFTRQSIHDLFQREDWTVIEEYYLEDPINLGSKHLFVRIRTN